MIESVCTRCKTGCFPPIIGYEPRFITAASFLLTFLWQWVEFGRLCPTLFSLDWRPYWSVCHWCVTHFLKIILDGSMIIYIKSSSVTVWWGSDSVGYSDILYLLMNFVHIVLPKPTILLKTWIAIIFLFLDV